ncbi:alpha/beta fold hydrolase [Motiliproteus sp. SC1-56]|uniref:alpha/beta fold hydrolase n=1 Tax=Motiliproteus sp. SC1-56 TaxID=2799565 RepID=UPI001A8EC2AB|nr:alpha/beta fold hydrolase [Motiliproteus sp. SC1-56]
MSELHVERYPQPEAPALVLVHGWGMHSGVWSDWLQALKPHFDLTLVDLPGLGRSSGLPVEAYTLEVLADRLAAVMTRPAIWLGWSLGGLVAAQVAHRHPGKVRGLVTLATNPCFVVCPDWSHAMPRATFDRFSLDLEADWRQTLNRFVMLQGQGDEQARPVIRALKGAVELYRELPPAQLGPALMLLDGDYRPCFAALDCPRLHLFGAEDQLVPAEVASQPPLAPHAQVLPGAGHVLFLSCPQRVLDALLAFSRELA